MSTTQLLQPSPSVKKSLGTVLLLFFGLTLIRSFSFYATIFSLHSFDYHIQLWQFYEVVGVVLNLLAFALLIYAGCRRKFFINTLGRIGAFLLGALYIWFAIVRSLGLFEIFLNDGWLIPLENVLFLAFMAIFIFCSRAWLPVKIFAVLWALPGILWASIYKAFETHIDPRIMEIIGNFVDIVSAALSILTMVLIIVWMLRKEKTEIA